MSPRTGRKPKPWFLRSALIRSMRWRKAYTALPASLAMRSRHSLRQKGSFADPSRKRGRLDVLLFGRRRRIDADRTRDMSGERNDVFACGVAGVDQQSIGRPAVAAGGGGDPRARPGPPGGPGRPPPPDKDPLPRRRPELRAVDAPDR